MKTITFMGIAFIIFLFGRLMATEFTLVGPCECGIFFANNRFDKNSTKRPILVQTVNYNICDVAGERLCKMLCVSVNKITKVDDVDVLCKTIGNASNILLKVLSKNCDAKWIDTNLFATEPLCCSDGQDVVCERLA